MSLQPYVQKTYKRETAWALVLWLVYIVETKNAETIELLVWPVFTFLALAYGMQWAAPNGSVFNKPIESTDGRGA